MHIKSLSNYLVEYKTDLYPDPNYYDKIILICQIDQGTKCQYVSVSDIPFLVYNYEKLPYKYNSRKCINGKCYEWDNNKRILCISDGKNNLSHGKNYRWHENYVLQEIENYSNGNLMGKSYYFNDEGILVRMSDHKLNSRIYIDFYISGRCSMYRFTKNKCHQEEKSWDLDGKLINHTIQTDEFMTFYDENHGVIQSVKCPFMDIEYNRNNLEFYCH